MVAKGWCLVLLRGLFAKIAVDGNNQDFGALIPGESSCVEEENGQRRDVTLFDDS